MAEPSVLSIAPTNSSSSVSIVRTNLIGTSSSNPQDVIQQRVRTLSQVPSYQFPSDLPKYYFSIFENDWQLASTSLTLKKVYKLPLPMTIQDAFSVNFDQNFSYLDAAATALTSLSTVASTAAGAISAVGSAVQAASGYTLNSIKTVTLKSPDFRQFTLNWKFAPKTPQESLNIQMLLYSLRKGMTPQAELAGLAFEFPRIYTMFFSPNPQWLFKFKPCVLKNLSVNYQGNNPIPSFFTSEAPESIAVQMTWLELEYWKRSDYKGEDFPTQDPLDNFNWYEYRPPLTEQELAALWEEARDAEQGAFVVGGPR